MFAHHGNTGSVLLLASNFFNGTIALDPFVVGYLVTAPAVLPAAFRRCMSIHPSYNLNIFNTPPTNMTVPAAATFTLTQCENATLPGLAVNIKVTVTGLPVAINISNSAIVINGFAYEISTCFVILDTKTCEIGMHLVPFAHSWFTQSIRILDCDPMGNYLGFVNYTLLSWKVVQHDKFNLLTLTVNRLLSGARREVILKRVRLPLS